MNEGIKTGSFLGVALVIIGVATIVAWPRTAEQNVNRVGLNLIETFENPLDASSMKIVTFDEEQGQLETFEVRKDRETDQWTIPSRDGYPADAMEQMKNAANAFVGLKILDIQTNNAEDHDDLGVAEPKLEDLEVGDEGVGRLVIFKDDAQSTLAELIIGDALKDDPSKRYVRVPGQDPVYVVKLDESPLTTLFQDWIEDDLLQLSSIDISELEIKDYSASLGLGGQISLTRNYTADVAMEGTEWVLDRLVEFDPKNPMADPTPVTVGPDKTLNKTKLDEMKNALDDLKIADVVRKPDGMSANLRANQDLLSDKDAVGSLAQRGFYPVPSGPKGETEILSANGELNVSLKDGIKYVMRFGNIAGVSDSEDSSETESQGGVNRYLLVTTMVDQSKFPAPDLKPVPKTLEELEALLNPPNEEPAADVPASEVDDAGADSPPKVEAANEKAANEKVKDESEAEVTQDADEASESKESSDTPKQSVTSDSASDSPSEAETKNAEPQTDAGEADAGEADAGEADSSGSGETTGKGEAQEASAQEADSEETDAKNAIEGNAAEDSKDGAPESTAEDEDSGKGNDAESSTNEKSEEGSEGKSKDSTPKEEELTEEEQLERLEAEQEKITKENQRKVDERKDRLEAAERRVRDLNARFADWYYVIPEETYSKLRISREELFTDPDSAAPAQPPLNGGPQFNFNGLPGN